MPTTPACADAGRGEPADLRAMADDERKAARENGRHVIPDFGLPYASADVDDGGYFLTCPVCGFIARAVFPRTEDAATTGAAAAYAEHFMAEAASR